MTDEDDAPAPRTPLLTSPPLDRLGVAELRSYIAGLRREISRAETEIIRKDGLRAAADSVFKTDAR